MNRLVSSKAKKRKPKPTKLTHKKKRRIPDLGENEADEIATAVLGAVSGTKEETTSSCLEDINQVLVSLQLLSSVLHAVFDH